MQNNSEKKTNRKLIFIRVLLGFAIVIITFHLSANADIKDAYQILDRTTTYIIEQSNRYSLIRLSSESKSLTRLLEGCKYVEDELSMGKASVTEDDLKEYVRANYLTGVMLLDENGNIVSEYSKDENTDYLLDEYLKNESLLETAKYPQKQYAVRYPLENGDELDIAAICRMDAPGIIVTFFHTPKEYKESFSLNFKALLDGFSMENAGTVVISDGDSVIASNDESLIGKKPNEIEFVNKIHTDTSNRKVIVAKQNSNSLQHDLGLMKQGRDVFVYAFMPEREVYKKTPQIVFIALFIYLFGLGLLVYTRSKAKQTNREEQLKLKEQYAANLEAKNEELKKAVDNANRANAAKSNFLARMSHDIRTPINGIVGLAKISKDHFSDKELVFANFDKMQIAADHLLSLINDILQMSKVEDGTVQLTYEFINLSELSASINAIIEERAIDQGINLDFKMGKAKHFPNVYGSPVHLRQIFLNIYGNSIKYNRPGGKITTMADVIEECDGRCTYQWTITDTGIGMSEEFVKRIFEPFTQEKEDARTNYQGVGLGMSIVKGLLDEMGGKISISSKEGVGTTFIITIPFEIADEVENDEGKIAEKSMDITGLHLLLVEDNGLNAEIAEMLLTDEDAKVTLVTDGQQAVNLFNEKPEGTFDAILMDMMMPVMDGLTATKEIRKIDRPDAKTIPIIAMTANAFEEDKEKCLEAGMNAHMAKPLDVEIVKKTVCEFIKKK